MYPQNLWKKISETKSVVDHNRRVGVLHALFRDAAFDDYFAECSPLPAPFFMTERIDYPPTNSNQEGTMLNWIITFFLLAIVAAVLGFGGLAGTFAEIAKILAVMFVVLFIASLVYSVVTGRRPSPPIV